jgi:predicted membrane metal-binding protein
MLSALSIAGIGTLLWHPEEVYSLGFQLSFIVTIAFALFARWRPTHERAFREVVKQRFRDGFRASLVVSLSAFPIVAYSIGVVSVLGLIANMMVFGCLPLMVTAGFVSHLLWLCSPSLGQGAAIVAITPLADWIIFCSRLMSPGWGTVSLQGFSGYWLVIYYGAWLAVYRRSVVQP